MIIGAAQLAPIQRTDSRGDVVKRLLALLHEAKARGAELVVFPELGLTTFFPRWWMTDPSEIDAFFETEMPGPETKPLFDEARRLGLGFCLGYAEKTADGHRYNTSILVDAGGRVVLKYRKIHLPGHAEHEPRRHSSWFERRLCRRNPGSGGRQGEIEPPGSIRPSEGGQSPPPRTQRTSSVSRRPSPTRLMASTVSARKRPGKRMIQNASCTYVLPSAMMLPHEGMWGGVPAPRKDR